MRDTFAWPRCGAADGIVDGIKIDLDIGEGRIRSQGCRRPGGVGTDVVALDHVSARRAWTFDAHVVAGSAEILIGTDDVASGGRGAADGVVGRFDNDGYALINVRGMAVNAGCRWSRPTMLPWMTLSLVPPANADARRPSLPLMTAAIAGR